MAANKLTVRIVKRILRDLDRDTPISVVARKYGISVPLTWMIDRRKLWRHVPRPSDRDPVERQETYSLRSDVDREAFERRIREYEQRAAVGLPLFDRSMDGMNLDWAAIHAEAA